MFEDDSPTGNPFEFRHTNIDEDMEVGFHPCRLTGKFDGQFVEVSMLHNINQFARVLHPFGFFGASLSQEFISKNADSLIGYVTFEKGDPARALLVAVAFKDGKEHDIEDYPRSATLLSEMFKLQFNDKSNEGYVKHSGKFFLGSPTASENMVLGKVLLSKLEAVCDKLSDLCTQISALTVVTLGVPSATPVNSAAFTAIGTYVAALKGTLSSIKSDKNFVD
jgi:hypothetical protein